MTATKSLRQLLDARGVEHIDYKDEATWWSNGDVECAYIQSAIFNDELGQLSFMATPEQAVEATLGPAVPPPELPDVPYDLLIDELRDTWGIEASWDGLRKFWYLGWTEEYVEDMGRLHDELCDAVAEGSTVKAHRILDSARFAGRGTCKNVYEKGHFKCSGCGHYTQTRMVYRDGKPADPRYCPNCGRRVANEQ